MRKNEEREGISLDEAVKYLNSYKLEDIIQRTLSKQVLKATAKASILILTPVIFLTSIAGFPVAIMGLLAIPPVFYFLYKEQRSTYANGLKILAEDEEEYRKLKYARAYTRNGYRNEWYVEDEIIGALKALKKYKQGLPLSNTDALNIFSLYYRTKQQV